MIKNNLKFGILLTGLLILGACAKKPDNTIRIGELVSMTGGTAHFGQATHEGTLLATEEANAAGGLLGKQIELFTEDDQSRPEEAKTATLKLIKQDKVHAIIGEVASSRTLAAAPEAQRNGIPMVSPSSTNPKVTEVGDYIFRVCFIDPFQGYVMAKFAYENLGYRKVAVLKDIKNDYSVGLAESFTKTFQELGGSVVRTESYSEGDIEFRPQLTSLKPIEPEAIFVPGYYIEMGLIARQARELGYKGIFLGGDGWDSPKLTELAGGDALDGSYYSNHYAPDDPDPLVRAFAQKFKARFGHLPDGLTVMGYDAALVLFDAIRKAGSLDGKAIRDALAATKDFPAVSAKLTMDASRNPTKRAVVLKVENQKSVYFSSVEPL